jgi:hypothetical protein
MTRFISKRTRRSRVAVAGASLSVLAMLGAILVLAGSSAAATPTTVGLGTAGNFAVLAGTSVTDVPASAITGNVGLSPTTGAGITGLTCPEVTGTIYSVDASGPLPCRITNAPLLTTAENDMSTAYGDAAGRTPFTTLLGTVVPADNQLGGKTLGPGVYRLASATTANLTGNVTLSGSASDVWIFQASSNLVFSSSSTVNFSGGAQACNVFWQVGTSATIGTGANISGTILAGASITAATGATITGRLLAAVTVTLDHNTIVRPTCATAPGAQPPGRALYCAPNGQSYDLVNGQDKEPPYDALHLVPATVDPVTGSVSCAPASVAVTTTTTATTPTTTTTVPPPVTTTTSSVTKPPAKKPPATKTKSGVKAAKRVHIAHVAPKPARHQGGFTG